VKNGLAGPVAAALLALTLAPAARAAGPIVWDQSDLDLSNSDSISDVVVGTDFVLTAPARISGATVWLVDDEANDDGQLGSFDGVLSWAIYGHDAENFAPDAPIRSGLALELLLTDTGLQHDGTADVVEARFELDQPLSLTAGTYWLVLHEGTWASVYDGDHVRWLRAVLQVGANRATAADEEEPGDWQLQVGDPSLVVEASPTVWDQSAHSASAGGTDCSSQVVANDFQFAAPASFSSLEVWLSDGATGDNGVLDHFSGVLSWAVYANGVGDKPGGEVASGTGTTWALVDTAFQNVTDRDVARVQISLDRTVQLSAGTYWLAVHEGEWLSIFDNFSVALYDSTTLLLGGQWVDANEQTPGTWGSSNGFNSALVLLDDLLFGSGFEAGTTCAWSNGPAVDCP
jgi:hypothetical protein